MSINKTILKIKESINLDEVLPNYGFSLENIGEHSFWAKSIVISKWGFIGVDRIFINKDTGIIDYYRKPIFNYDLCNCIKDLIDNDLVDVIIEKEKSDNYTEVKLPTLSDLLGIEERQRFRFIYDNEDMCNKYGDSTYVIIDNKLCCADDIPYETSKYLINTFLNNGIIGIRLIEG